MGYKNDVRIAMKEDNFNTLIERGREKDFTDHNYLLDENAMNYVKKVDGIVVFGWDWVKWNEDFVDVKFILDFLDEMREEGYPFQFVRIGEDVDDNEEIWYRGPNDDDYSCDVIGISREIYCDIEPND